MHSVQSSFNNCLCVLYPKTCGIQTPNKTHAIKFKSYLHPIHPFGTFYLSFSVLLSLVSLLLFSLSLSLSLSLSFVLIVFLFLFLPP